ncbi:gonadal somatic cell derived factor isoform X4 [Silurus meridionalis]|nr:gonadal somatic cell derived factor isoform X4 [Silurus meridionalis]
MSLVLVVSLVLAACHLGKASVLRPSPEEPADAESPQVIRMNGCQEDLLQNVYKVVLDSLNLQSEPDVSVPGMAQIREQWSKFFKSTTNPNPLETHAADNTQPISSSSSSSLSSSSSRSGNSAHLQCCKFASEIFIKDLGWDKWIIYPESFTFVQCGVCVPQQNMRMFNCRDDDLSALDPPSQKPCCEATSHDSVPFLYVDKMRSLVISSVSLPRECGCGHSDDTQTLQP